jgi:hypothetical protein
MHKSTTGLMQSVVYNPRKMTDQKLTLENSHALQTTDIQTQLLQSDSYFAKMS